MKTTAICIVWAAFLEAAENDPLGVTPYRTAVFIFHEEKFPLPDRELVAALSTRCRALIGEFWKLQIEFPDASTADDVRKRFSDPKPEDESVDKIIIVEFRQSGCRFEIEEFDTRTRQTGPRIRYAVDDPAKTVDLLVQALFDVFRPVAKLERASQRTATLQLQGSEIFRPEVVSTDIPVPGGVFMPFLRSRDREGRTVAVVPIPWTVLVVEEIDPMTQLLHCRIESGLHDPFGVRFRGRSEIFALSAATPSVATVLRLQPRSDAESSKNLPPYEVCEFVPGESTLRSLGRTAPDGTFKLEPVEDRAVRNLVIQNGRTIVARLPVVRGWAAECTIPVPDDRVRLEAEAALLGLQEELIDVTARREILSRREQKYRETGDLKKAGEMRNERSRLKDTERFLIELEQTRLRFQSTDPIVRRRLERLFRETEDAIKKPR